MPIPQLMRYSRSPGANPAEASMSWLVMPALYRAG
jgi:hypothetical protein